MAHLKLRYVKEYRDRHGKLRRYFRRPDTKLIPLPGLPGSREFMDAYQAALDGKPDQGVGSERSKPGTVAALVAAYYTSSSYKTLAPTTKTAYRGEIERFRAKHGEKRVAKLQREHIERFIDEKAENTPGAANKLLRFIRMLMRFAIHRGWRTDDPTAGLKRLKIRNSGFKAWEEHHIALFEQTHPVGSRARLALALLLFTAQRRSDVVRMGWQHVLGDRISVRQQKTDAFLLLPIHPDLYAVLAATKRDNMSFLTTSSGKPLTAESFGNWFRDCCRKAGLPAGFNSHGLRKAAARRLAEAGCSPHEIMAITGHKTLSEVERYTRSVNQERLAAKAMRRLGTDGEH